MKLLPTLSIVYHQQNGNPNRIGVFSMHALDQLTLQNDFVLWVNHKVNTRIGS